MCVCLSVCGQPENLPYYILLQHPGCSRMFQNVPKSSRMFQNVPESSRKFKNVPESSRMLTVSKSKPWNNNVMQLNSVCVHSLGCTDCMQKKRGCMQWQKLACTYIRLFISFNQSSLCPKKVWNITEILQHDVF